MGPFAHSLALSRTHLIIGNQTYPRTAQVDHTPRLRKVEEIIGADGGLAFVGSLEELDVVVVCCRNNKYLLPSSAKLPFPLHKEPVRGDMLLMRSDEVSQAH